MSISLNLVVIRVSNLEKSVAFYQTLGLHFIKEKHGDGPEHYACELEQLVFEIYPSQKDSIDHTLRLGFQVDNIEMIMKKFSSSGDIVVSPPTVSQWGKRAVLRDPDGYKVELLEKITE
ncbi:VOC family protein [Metabacillus malikii]|uniref:Catechol 2,3-dioxygenase-like lactoylglutathione lyase family enzyme n=1 Tax=Metabacillus malikii TaxID=1504265 RepID=A0ABT9Z9U9_9BACI|nr:VOC family protein [Metabacillus malikii]MDQ0229031.1 catechol 2,3-dioxygenase-like lactoylglutathione lyase family enzyme [Metabacillus malikii]